MSDKTNPNRIEVDLKALGIDIQNVNTKNNGANIQPMKLVNVNESALPLKTLKYTKDEKTEKK